MVRNLVVELSEVVRRGKLRHTDITQEGEPEEDEETDAGDSAPNVRHGRPDVQHEPGEDSAVEPSKQSLTVLEPEEERVRTEHTSSDLEEPSRGERCGGSWDNQTLANRDVDPAFGIGNC